MFQVGLSRPTIVIAAGATTGIAIPASQHTGLDPQARVHCDG